MKQPSERGWKHATIQEITVTMMNKLLTVITLLSFSFGLMQISISVKRNSC